MVWATTADMGCPEGLRGEFTYLGTDGLLWRAGGTGKLGEVEHVYRVGIDPFKPIGRV